MFRRVLLNATHNFKERFIVTEEIIYLFITLRTHCFEIWFFGWAVASGWLFS